MAEYLVSSCGFDPDEAAKASKLLGRIESRHQPDSVLGFFKSHGFDNAHMKRVLSVNPRWLLLDVEKTLAPKFRALQDLGFSCSDITRLVSSNNAVINHKFQNVLSKIQFWQGTLGSNDLLMKFCKRNRWFLSYSIEKKIQPNIEILRDFGITDQKLSMILRCRPVLLAQKAETLKALIGRVEGLEVARTSGMFLKTLSVLQSVSEKNFKAHLEFFKGFGWSEDDFLAAFRKAPSLVTFSLKSLQRKMEFLVNETRCAPSYLAPRPGILLMKKKFLEKFVIRHTEFPELIELYNVSSNMMIRDCRRVSTIVSGAPFHSCNEVIAWNYSAFGAFIKLFYLQDTSIIVTKQICTNCLGNIFNKFLDNKIKDLTNTSTKTSLYATNEDSNNLTIVIATPPSLGLGEEKEHTKKEK
ncbi:unnamed protein product [Musa acuminata subsp. burmannicoides]